MKHIVGWLCILLVALISLGVRLSNPTLTETQLLVRFLWVWVATVGLGILGAWLIADTPNKKH